MLIGEKVVCLERSHGPSGSCMQHIACGRRFDPGPCLRVSFRPKSCERNPFVPLLHFKLKIPDFMNVTFFSFLIGMFVYFLYGIRNSTLENQPQQTIEMVAPQPGTAPIIGNSVANNYYSFPDPNESTTVVGKNDDISEADASNYYRYSEPQSVGALRSSAGYMQY